MIQWPYRREEVENEAVRRVMVKELLDQLGTYEHGLVDRAVTAAIARSEQWPPVSLILKCVNELRDLPPPGRPAWQDSDDGERYHAQTPEESERRAAQCKAWRKQYGFNTESAKAEPTEDDLGSLSRPFTPDELASAGRLIGKGSEDV